MPIDAMSNREAYLAMFAFLQQQYVLSRGDEIGALLGSMALLPDGRPADQALAQDWDQAVARACSGVVDATLRLGEKP
jgi:hypothetical protein